MFRTYNASVTLEEQLPSAEDLEDMSVADKVIKYNAANRMVAILCNHQKTVSKAAETQLETLQEKIVVMGQQKKELEAWRDLAKGNKAKKIPLLESEDDDEADLKAKIEEAKEALERAKPEDSETRLKARSDIDENKAALKKVQASKFKTKHMYKVEPTLESIEGRIKKWAEDIKKQQTDAQNKDENKEVALGTSKINYMVRRPSPFPLLFPHSPPPLHLILPLTPPPPLTCPPPPIYISVYPPLPHHRTPASPWPGASAARCPSTRSSPARCATSSTGPWPCRPTGSSSEGGGVGGQLVLEAGSGRYSENIFLNPIQIHNK